MKKICTIIALLITMQLLIRPEYAVFATDNDILKAHTNRKRSL